MSMGYKIVLFKTWEEFDKVVNDYLCDTSNKKYVSYRMNIVKDGTANGIEVYCCNDTYPHIYNIVIRSTKGHNYLELNKFTSFSISKVKGGHRINLGHKDGRSDIIQILVED